MDAEVRNAVKRIRAHYDTAALLGDSRLFSNALSDMLGDSGKKLRMQVQLAMDAGVGKLYLEQGASPDAGFYQRVQNVMEQCGLSPQAAAELMEVFDEAAGWAPRPAKTSAQPAFPVERSQGSASFCPQCGAETRGGGFCPNCGAPLTGEISSSGSSVYTAPQPAPSSDVSASDPAAYKLGWHKFLIYFALWGNSLIWILNGLGGFLLAGESPIFVVAGLLYLALGIFGIYVRFQLAQFRKGAPKKLLIYYGLDSLISLPMFLTDASDPGGISFLVFGVAFLVIAWRYYSSREALFIH